MLSLTRNKFIKTVIETVSLSWSCRRNQTEHSLARLFRDELSYKLFETKLKSLFLLSGVKCAAATTFATNNGSEKSIFTIWFDFVALFSKDYNDWLNLFSPQISTWDLSLNLFYSSLFSTYFKQQRRQRTTIWFPFERTKQSTRASKKSKSNLNQE